MFWPQFLQLGARLILGKQPVQNSMMPADSMKMEVAEPPILQWTQGHTPPLFR